MVQNNRRTYYAVEQVGIVPDGTSRVPGGCEVHGLQTIGSNVTFNTENILEIGQIDTYTSMENRPDVSFNMEKVFDGYPLIWHLATRKAAIDFDSGAATLSVKGLGARSEYKSVIYMGIYPDTQTTASNSSVACIQISGAYVSNLEYNLQRDGNFTESVSFVANDRTWLGVNGDGYNDYFDYDFTGANSPVYTSVYRRWDIDWENSRIPSDITGAEAVGSYYKNPYSTDPTATYAHIQSCRISTSLAREDLYELGRKAPYYRYAKFPVDVTCSFEVNSAKGDSKNAYAEQTNLSNQLIDIIVGKSTDNYATNNKIRFYLGPKNKLTSIDLSGGSVDGAVLAQTYNYVNQNTLTVAADKDLGGLAGTSIYLAVH